MRWTLDYTLYKEQKQLIWIIYLEFVLCIGREYQSFLIIFFSVSFVCSLVEGPGFIDTSIKNILEINFFLLEKDYHQEQQTQLIIMNRKTFQVCKDIDLHTYNCTHRINSTFVLFQKIRSFNTFLHAIHIQHLQ